MPCLGWCNAYTCGLTGCLNCGPSKGCSVQEWGKREDTTGIARNDCADWCSMWTCDKDECVDCGHDKGCEGREPPLPPSPPPHPARPPLSQYKRGIRKAEYFAYGSGIYTNAWGDAGAPFPLLIRGASWFGMETEACFLGGADKRDIASTAQWLGGQGFNAIRLPLAADAILHPTGHPCTRLGDQDGLRLNNIGLGALTYVEQIAEIVRVAGDAGLLVLLDMHVLNAGIWPDGGTVGSSARDNLFAAWRSLASSLCDADKYWNIIGADLKNEPYSMFWGDPGDDSSTGFYESGDRWDSLAGELGHEVLEHCPRWLLFVQGVGECRVEGWPCEKPSAPGHQNMDLQAGTCKDKQRVVPFCDCADDHRWGENLQNAAHFPVHVGDEEQLIKKVVYSPHTYGPSIAHQKQFENPAFPANMPSIWDTQWAYLARDDVAPVVLGEFGGLCTGLDLTLQKALIDFIAQRRIGGFWWSLNPESGDTGGLIKEWQSLEPETVKLELVRSLPATNVISKRSINKHAGGQNVDDREGLSADDTSQRTQNSPSTFSPPPPLPSPPPPPPRAVHLEVEVVHEHDGQVGFLWPPPGPHPPPSPALGHHKGWTSFSAPPPPLNERSMVPLVLMCAIVASVCCIGCIGSCVSRLLRALDERAAHRMSEERKMQKAAIRAATRSKNNRSLRTATKVTWQRVPAGVDPVDEGTGLDLCHAKLQAVENGARATSEHDGDIDSSLEHAALTSLKKSPSSASHEAKRSYEHGGTLSEAIAAAEAAVATVDALSRHVCMDEDA